METSNDDATVITGTEMSNDDAAVISGMETSKDDAAVISVTEISNDDATVVSGMEISKDDATFITGMKMSNDDAAVISGMQSSNDDATFITGTEMSNDDAAVISGMEISKDDATVITGTEMSNDDATVISEMEISKDDATFITGMKMSNDDATVISGMEISKDDATVITGTEMSNDDAAVISGMETSKDDATVLSGRKMELERKQRSKYRSTYNESNIHMAYTLVTEKKASIRKAAQRCGVPLTTLRDRLFTGVNAPRHFGALPLLPREEEEKLINHLLLQAASGHPPSKKEIINLATETAVLLGKKPANSGKLTRRWYANFKKRWPQLCFSQTNKLTSQETLSSYFEKLDQILTDSEIKNRPQCMFYVEEACFQTDTESGKVAEPCNFKGNTKASRCEPRTTVFSCGTALGTYLPLYFVFEGERRDDMLSDNAIPGSKFSITNLGCTKGKAFKKFLEDHFIPHLPRKMQEEPVILFYDRRLYYISVTLTKFCEQNCIILYALPPYINRIRNPRDNGLFKPLKKYFHRECYRQLMRERPGEVITGFDVCKHVCTSYLEVCTPLRRINFFKQIGIFPLNPHALAYQ